MRWIDILSTALSSLMQRKLRSGLTMLGVVIGTTAIVVTISLGYGAEATQMKALEEYTNLRQITVYPFYSYSSSSDSVSGQRITKITDSVLNRIRRIQGVSAVTPVVSIYGNVEFILSTGKYQSSIMLNAVYPEDFAKLMNLKTGTGFTNRTDRMEFIMSEVSMMEFRDPKKETEYVDIYEYMMNGEELPLPKINWLNTNYDLTMRWEEYDEDGVNEDPIERTEEFKAKMVGTLEANMNDWTFAYGAIVNLNWYKRFYRENKDTLKELGMEPIENYDNVYVLADSVDDVSNVVRELNEMGVQCYSPMDMVDQFKKQIQTMQTFLGFIGAISMMVAALSIANTMMMSIYERTREIGVMKVLGCRMSNIRLMFLSEAAFIGLFGGALGLIASYSLSYALNNVEWLQKIVESVMSSSSLFSGDGSSTSIIPTSLALGTWGFVVLISIASGFYPAQRAMRLSSLAAIRSSE